MILARWPVRLKSLSLLHWPVSGPSLQIGIYRLERARACSFTAPRRCRAALVSAHCRSVSLSMHLKRLAKHASLLRLQSPSKPSGHLSCTSRRIRLLAARWPVRKSPSFLHWPSLALISPIGIYRLERCSRTFVHGPEALSSRTGIAPLSKSSR